MIAEAGCAPHGGRLSEFVMLKLILTEALLEHFARLFHFKYSFLPLFQVTYICWFLVDLSEHFALLDVICDPGRHLFIPSVLHRMQISWNSWNCGCWSLGRFANFYLSFYARFLIIRLILVIVDKRPHLGERQRRAQLLYRLDPILVWSFGSSIYVFVQVIVSLGISRRHLVLSLAWTLHE